MQESTLRVEGESNLQVYLELYKYQPELTQRLDDIGNSIITSEVLHEIVLWKINRYPNVPEAILVRVNLLKNLERKRYRDAEPVIIDLLSCKGVDLPMASTLLRFRNPETFQIIDRHAYRAVYGKKYPLYANSPSKLKTETYFNYLEALHELSEKKSILFRDLDRALYEFDKKRNGKL